MMRLKVSTANGERRYNGTFQILEGGVLKIDQDGGPTASPTICLSPAFWQEITGEELLGDAFYDADVFCNSEVEAQGT
jgi:hypothetical protein